MSPARARSMATSPSAARSRIGRPSAPWPSADQSSSQTRKGVARAPARPSASRSSRLQAWKRPAFRVGEREVREVELARRPGGRPRGGGGGGGRRQRGAEERELESEVTTGRGLEVPGVVPPLGAELGVRPVVGGKRERPRRQRAGEPGQVPPAERRAHRQARLDAASPRANGPPGEGEQHADQEQAHRQAGRRAGAPTHRGARRRAARAPFSTPDRARPAPPPARTGPPPAPGSRATDRWAWSSRTSDG